jgi:hypothetical protein
MRLMDSRARRQRVLTTVKLEDGTTVAAYIYALRDPRAQLNLERQAVMTPRIFALMSSDLAEGALPPDPSNCSVILTATIGPTDGNGGDNFDFEVVTPPYLQEHPAVRWGRGMLLVETFSWTTVRAMLDRLLAHAVRPTWNEVAAELNKELRWEYDNYTPSRSSGSGG